jgi:hypothetical protein
VLLNGDWEGWRNDKTIGGIAKCCRGELTKLLKPDDVGPGSRVTLTLNIWIYHEIRLFGVW